MRFLCLCPLWNHRHETIENAVQCFADQTYKDAYMILIDDRPESHRAFDVDQEDCYLLHMKDRASSLPAKYNYALHLALQAQVDFDAVAIWDDDDGFLPTHLEAAARAYETQECLWTYPNEVLTTFGNVVHTEESGGRFWSSITVSKKLLAEMGGFEDTRWCTFDQIFLGKAASLAKPGRPDHTTYCYRWDGGNAENHCSGYMGGGTDETWFEKTPYSMSGRWIVPGYDEDWKEKLREIHQNFPELLPQLPYAAI